MLTTALEVLGVLCIAGLLACVWLPLALAPIGLFLLVSGYQMAGGEDE